MKIAPYAFVLAVVAVFVAVAMLGASFPLERELGLIAATGWAAFGALGLALCATPVGALVAKLTKRAFPIATIRRALGIAAAMFATVHGAFAFVTYLGGSLARALEIGWVRTGAFAWFVLVVLWMTSYPSVVRMLRVRAWKSLHRLAYAAAFLAIVHALFTPMASRTVVLAGAAVLLVIAIGGRIAAR